MAVFKHFLQMVALKDSVNSKRINFVATVILENVIGNDNM